METLSHNHIQQIIKENIKSFNVFEFCPDGGWPNFDQLEVSVNSVIEKGQSQQANITLYYHCTMPASCFRGISQEVCMLNKEVLVSKEDSGNFILSIL